MKNGFTLIEILIVVAIISTLSSIILVGLGPAQKIGRDARRIADLREVQTGLEVYFTKCDYYPGGVEPSALGCGPFTPVSGWADLVNSLLSSNLGIKQVPNDPRESLGKTYFYGASSNGSGYVLGATLEDPNNQSLAHDVDGLVNGVNCDDPVYCIEF